MICIFRHNNIFGDVPLAVPGNVFVGLISSIRVFDCKFLEVCNPFSLAVFPLLIFQNFLHHPAEVLSAKSFQRLIFVLNALNLIQLCVVRKSGAAKFCPAERIPVKRKELHPAADGGLGEARLGCHLLYRIAQIQHQLEALRLLIGSQVTTLHVLNHHGLQLFPFVHFHDHAGHFKQSCLLCGRGPAMPDDDGVVIAGPHSLGCPCCRCCCGIPALVNALRNVLPAVEVVAGDNGQVLEDAVLFDAGGKFRQIPQFLAGVVRVRMQSPARNVRDLCHDLFSSMVSEKCELPGLGLTQRRCSIILFVFRLCLLGLAADRLHQKFYLRPLAAQKPNVRRKERCVPNPALRPRREQPTAIIRGAWFCNGVPDDYISSTA